MASPDFSAAIEPPPESGPPAEADVDRLYVSLLTTPLGICRTYQPKFGRGLAGATSLEEFRRIYGADPFYHWAGLDSPLMYAAHKAAGGMTSIYRQLGIGCEAVFRRLLQDRLGLSALEATWSYQVPGASNTPRTLYLDGRIDLSLLHNPEHVNRVRAWLDVAEDDLLLQPDDRATIRGAVFEVRQGYKSKDSKRQNADIANAANAYAHRYIPVLALFSVQIDGSVVLRYRSNRWLVLSGQTAGSPVDSLYQFCRQVLDYDLVAFFQRNSSEVRTAVESAVAALLTV